MRTALVCCLLAIATPAFAARETLREVIHPQADLPAFQCLVPVHWTSTVDATGNLQLANPDHSATFSLSFAHANNPPEALDALAKVVLAGAVVAPWDSRVPTEISGHRGFRYAARVRHTNGVEVQAEILLVPADDHHIAACSMLLSARVKPDEEATARLVQAAVKLRAAP